MLVRSCICACGWNVRLSRGNRGVSRDFGLDELKGEPSPDTGFQPLDGHKVLRTLAAVVAAAALVFIGIQEKRQTDLTEQQNTILACYSDQESAYDALMLGPGPGNARLDVTLEYRTLYRECRAADE